MGYYTQFSLEVSGPTEAYFAARNEEIEYLSLTVGKFQDGIEVECKWYDHVDDMKRISSKHPEVLFTLTGEGEEPGDLWVKYFKAGKVQVAKARIDYEDFDPKKLV
jgi:hypothetical protein